LDYLNFATRAGDRHERSRQWRAVTRAVHAELDDDREASIRGGDLGELRICAVALGAHRVEADQRGAVGDESLAKFLFQEEGSSCIEQGGRSVTLAAGQWFAIDKQRPFCIQASGTGRQLALVLPARRVAGWNTAALAFAAPRSFLRGAGQVLHASIATAVVAAAGLGRRDRARLGEALAGLLNVAWDADPTAETVRTSGGRRAGVIDYVERNLADPDLDVARIAKALGYSKRSLHKLFVGDATTVSRLIWERRLEHCRLALLDPALARRSITEIAHHWGFSDSQHFSRAFKARFGASPRQFRNAH